MNPYYVPAPSPDPDTFFVAWKASATILGYQYFGDGTEQGLTNAVTKDDLQPRIDDIKRDFRGLSQGTRAHLACVVSFFNQSVGQALAKRAERPNFMSLFIRLDQQRAQQVLQMIVSYPGW